MSQQLPHENSNPAVLSNYYEGPAADPMGDEVWCYSDRLCYSPGDTIALHVSSAAVGP
jgi:hypothetical protein